MRVVLRGLLQEAREAVAELAEQEDRDQRDAQQQHGGLDDLHPGGALHAAHQHVDHHDRADRGDHQGLAEPAVDVEQQRHQTAGTGDLGHHVDDRDGQCRGGGRGPHRTLAHPEAEHIAHGEAAGVAGALCDQQQVDQPGDQEADGVQEAVIAVDRDRPGDAQEGRGGQVVTGERDAVLHAAERAARDEVVAGGAPVAHPVHDEQRDQHEHREHAGVDDRVAGRDQLRFVHRSYSPASSRIRSTWGSMRRRANRVYSVVRPTVVTN